MIEAVLLEFEGVIADTESARREALLHTLAEDGVDLTDDEYVERCAAMPIRAAARNAYTLRERACDETIADLVALRAQRKFGLALETGLSLVDGARSFIESLLGRTRLGIVSRAARTEIDATLRLASLDHAFEFIISDNDTFAPKPSPAPYLGALDRLARRRVVRPLHVIALEDGSVGIRSAKSAGVRCAAVGAVPVHLAVDADALIPSLAGQTAASLDALTLGTRTADR